ncbi:MAG: 2-dehydropantoate 2-reductase [Cypionkella sp.]|nr:2-dehydropantoate 2-reductase [Cypionkella sp.]
MTKPILIWGAGAIGGTLGVAFLRAGRDVVFVDNVTAHVDAVNHTGLRIEGPIFQDVRKATALLPQDVSGQYDTIFLCVKALHTEDAARALAPHLAPEGVVVSAQNGLNENIIARVVGAQRTIGCFVNFGADYLEPGVVHYSGHGAVVVGELDGRISPRIQELHRLLLLFDGNAVLSTNIWGYLWGKLIYGALLFATALTNDSIADVFANPNARLVLTRLAQETGAVAAAERIQTEAFDGFDPKAFTPFAAQTAIDRSFDDMVLHNRRSAKSHTGIWRDLAIRKRKTEAAAQLGPIVEAGMRHGIATPLTSRLIAMVQQIESGQRPLASENLAVLADTAPL